MNKDQDHLAAAPKQQLPEPAGLVFFEGGAYEQGWVSSQDAYTADQLHAAIAAQAEKHAAELSTLRQHLAEAGRDGWTDAEADAARLALELECLLTDKDVPMPTLSRWWDSAHEALELHRARFRTAIAAQGEAKPAGVERELFDGE